MTRWLSVGVYLLVLAATPLLHHDIECHLNTPGHCSACMASPLGLGAVTGAADAVPHLPDAGSIKAISKVAPDRIFAVDTPGRAPPA